MDAKELAEKLKQVNKVVESALDNESQELWEEAYNLAEGLQEDLVSAELLVEFCAERKRWIVF